MTVKDLKDITQDYIDKVQKNASATSIENLKSIIAELENNLEEFKWEDVRIVHKIFTEEYQKKLQNNKE